MSLYKHWMMVCVESKPTTAEVYRVLTGTEWRWHWGQSTQVQGLHKCWKRWQQMACVLWVNPQQQTGRAELAGSKHWGLAHGGEWWAGREHQAWQRASVAESQHWNWHMLWVNPQQCSSTVECLVVGWWWRAEDNVDSEKKKKKADKWGHMTWSLALHCHCCSPLPPPPPTPPLFTTTTTATLQHHHCTCPHLQRATTD